MSAICRTIKDTTVSCINSFSAKSGSHCHSRVSESHCDSADVSFHSASFIKAYVPDRERWFPGQDVWYHSTPLLQAEHCCASSGTVCAAVCQGKALCQCIVYWKQFNVNRCVELCSSLVGRWWWRNIFPCCHVSSLHLHICSGGELFIMFTHPSL